MQKRNGDIMIGEPSTNFVYPMCLFWSATPLEGQPAKNYDWDKAAWGKRPDKGSPSWDHLYIESI